MSKYLKLWNYIKEQDLENLKLTYAQIEEILGFPIDHSFLTYKKELNDYGYIIKKISMKDKIIVIEGGETRNGTILNSIQYMKGQNCEKDSILVTHDASRIFVSKKLIKDSIKYAIEVGAASAAIPATDVIFETEIDGKLTGVPLRKYLCHAQTPQSFNIDKFLDIYEDLSEEEISKLDEAMVLFHLRNADVKLFPGDQNNFKINQFKTGW